MPKATAKHITPAVPADPVVEMSRKLLRLWDADDGAQTEHRETKVPEGVRDDTMGQIGEWRDAIAKTITYTQPTTLQGSLVQMALALDALSDISDFLGVDDKAGIENRVLRIDRLIRLAARKMSFAAPIDSELRSLLEIYGISVVNWIDHVGEWSEKGKDRRLAQNSPQS